MNSQITPYVFDGAEVRVSIGDDGEPWFVASDVCRALGVSDVGQALDRLDHDERGGCNVPTPGGQQQVRVVSEAGLYSLILTSRKPEAKRFKRWVTHEVLPSIRKTGGYGRKLADIDHGVALVAALNDPATLRQLLGDYAGRVQALEAGAAAAAPKIEAYDRIVESGDTLGFREAAKLIREGTGACEREVMTLMMRRGWVQRLGKRPAPTAIGRERGYVVSRMTEWTDDDGVTHVKPELRITPKGIDRAITLLNSEAA